MFLKLHYHYLQLTCKPLRVGPNDLELNAINNIRLSALTPGKQPASLNSNVSYIIQTENSEVIDEIYKSICIEKPEEVKGTYAYQTLLLSFYFNLNWKIVTLKRPVNI